MANYADDELIRYEEAIQLHFDQTGMTAWLTMKNYGWVFGVAEPSDNTVKQVTIGVSAMQSDSQRDEQTRDWISGIGFTAGQFKPYTRSGPISISALLDAIHVIRFQIAILDYDERRIIDQRLQRGYRGYKRTDMNRAILFALSTAVLPVVLSSPITASGVSENRFHVATSVGLWRLMQQVPGAIAIYDSIQQFNSQSTGLTAYFPKPNLICQEQRSRLEGNPGKTKRQDIRHIKPLPSPSHVPISPITTDYVERSKTHGYGYEDFIDMLDLDYQERIKKNQKADKYDFLNRNTSPKTAGYLHKHVQRISCFAFRGDSRDPGVIKEGGGLLSGMTRNPEKDKGVEKFREAAVEIDAAIKKGKEALKEVIRKYDLLELGVYTLIEDFKGYVSTTTSTVIAKCFANLYKETADSTTYCYAVRCHGGFYLPTDLENATEDWKKGSDSRHRFIHFAEQEVAMPGAIPWDNDVVGTRVIRCNKDGQFFSGPVFLKDSLKQQDRAAFCELFELLSGRSQGEGFGIFRSYDKDPFVVRPRTKPALCESVSTGQVVSLSSSSISFGNQLLQSSGNVLLWLTNGGNQEISISRSGFAGKDPKDFRLEDDLPEKLDTGKSFKFRITFEPTTTGIRNACFQLKCIPNWPPVLKVELTGTCVHPLKLSTNCLDFGNQPVSTPSDPLQIILTNRYEKELGIQIRSPLKNGSLSDFRVLHSNPNGFDLDRDSTANFNMLFEPKTTGLHASEIQIIADGFPPCIVKLTGTGV